MEKTLEELRREEEIEILKAIKNKSFYDFVKTNGYNIKHDQAVKILSELIWYATESPCSFSVLDKLKFNPYFPLADHVGEKLSDYVLNEGYTFKKDVIIDSLAEVYAVILPMAGADDIFNNTCWSLINYEFYGLDGDVDWTSVEEKEMTLAAEKVFNSL